MQIRFGFDIAYELPSPAAVILMLRLRPEYDHRILRAERFRTRPNVPVEEFNDGYGNRCMRLVAHAGLLEFYCEGIVRDAGIPAPVDVDAKQHPVEELPPRLLPFLLPSRYCEVDLLGNLAWSLFGATAPGWARVQAICTWVHGHLTFDYLKARPTLTANEAFREGTGVCRDFTHLAITLCRCVNIPARYATGYLGEIGVPPEPTPMDFSAWMEVFLGGRWHTFDPRHNERRIGHLVMAYGRDAADVALTTSFGSHGLRRFKVVTEEVLYPIEAPREVESGSPGASARSDFKFA
jgi:transglutaminase-like putative cysteine protease